MIVLTAEQCGQVLLRDMYRESFLRPLLLTDGRYGIPDNVLNDPRQAHVRAILRQGTIVADNSVTLVASADQNYTLITVDGKNLYLGFATGFNWERAWPYPHHGPLTVVAPHLYRFEARYNDDHLSYDWENNRRRVELAQPDTTGPQMGQTWWTAWSTILPDERTALNGPNGTLIHQWFKTGSGPFVYVTIDAGQLALATRSNAGVYTTRYNAAFNPATGTPQNFVMRGVLGEAGHLDVWWNGNQVLNLDVPLGFWDVPSPNDPAYLHIASGIYQQNVTERCVLYLANLEFGTADLSARIASPLAVTVPPGGWV